VSDPSKAAVWAALLALPFSVAVAADPDLWWHVAAGRLTLASGAVPTADPWSYTALGDPWTNHEWLSGAALAFTFDTFGTWGLLGLRAALLFVLVFAWLRALQPRIGVAAAAVLLAGLAWPFVQTLCNLRPQTVTWALVPALVVLLDHVVRGRSWALWLTPALLILWANLHGGFLFGWGLAGLGLAFTAAGWERPPADDDRPPLTARFRVACAIALVPLIATPWLTPNGWRLPAYMWTELTTPHPSLPEWNPPPTPMLALLVATAAAPFLAWAVFRGRIRPALWIGLAVAFAQALQHTKFIVLVLLLAPICAAEVLGPALRTLLARDADLSSLVRHRAAAPAAIAVAWLSSLALWPRTIGEVWVDTELYPQAAIAWLDGTTGPDEGRLMLPLGWGGLAIYHLHPRWRVGNDGRNTTVYTPEHVERHGLAWDAGDLDAVLESRPQVILSPPSSAITDALRAAHDWQVVREDGTAVMFAQRSVSLAPPDRKTEASGRFP
jgi:hypothetical protein